MADKDKRIQQIVVILSVIAILIVIYAAAM